MNEKKMVGKRSVLFSRPPIIIGAGSVAGEKEGNGAFGKCFDMVEEDPLFGGKTWEEAARDGSDSARTGVQDGS